MPDGYTNRVCELIAHGRHVAEIAVLYHGEGEWTGKCMYSHKPAHLLADAQMDYDLIPQDGFCGQGWLKTVLEKGVAAGEYAGIQGIDRPLHGICDTSLCPGGR